MNFSYPFTEQEANAAYHAWGANCGPNALAVCLNMTLDQIRPHLGDFEVKRYMSPTMMKFAIASVGAVFKNLYSTSWPQHGVARIQWCGPWTEPGVNPKWAYRQTHWVHSRRKSQTEVWVFDVNGGWRSLASWEKEIVPGLTASVPRANGKWFLTHGWEVTPAVQNALMASQ